MYYYGAGMNACGCQTPSAMPNQCQPNNQGSYAIVLVLFILLVIVLGTKCSR